MRRHARRGWSGGGQQAGQRRLTPHGDMAGLQEHVADLHAQNQAEEAWWSAVWMSSAGQESECHVMRCVTRGMLTCQRYLASPRRPNILPRDFSPTPTKRLSFLTPEILALHPTRM